MTFSERYAVKRAKWDAERANREELDSPARAKPDINTFLRKINTVPVDERPQDFIDIFFSHSGARPIDHTDSYWVGLNVKTGAIEGRKVKVPLFPIRSVYDFPGPFRANEGLSHRELKYQAREWMLSCGADEALYEKYGWDVRAEFGGDLIRIECGCTPPSRMECLRHGVAAFVLIPFLEPNDPTFEAYIFRLLQPSLISGPRWLGGCAA